MSDDPDQQAVFLLRAVPFIPKIEQTQVRGVVLLLLFTALATSKPWKTAKNYSFLFLSRLYGWPWLDGAWQGGFSLDFYADRSLDAEGPWTTICHNPWWMVLSRRVQGFFSLSFIIVSFFLTSAVAPQTLFFWILILGIIVGLALHLFGTPLGRCLTLGLLQALYLLMGAMAGNLSLGLYLLAGMFFFGMFGGRGLIDIRDYSQDMATPVQTLPKRYGVKRTAQFTTICLLIA